jgi:hypothetical protein
MFGPGGRAEPAGLDVEPLAALSVRTGRDARRDVLITNRAGDRQVLSTNGMLHSAVTDSGVTLSTPLEITIRPKQHTERRPAVHGMLATQPRRTAAPSLRQHQETH